MLYVTGMRSTVIVELSKLIEEAPKRLAYDLTAPWAQDVPRDVDRMVLCAGVFHGKQIADQSDYEIRQSLAVNMVSAVQIIDAVLEVNDRARICVIGSESGIKGSNDTTYALAKAGLHKYVETRAVGPNQQLVCVAPSIIWDTGMTRNRPDSEVLANNAWKHPRGRYLRAKEVAKLVHFLLYVDNGYLTNTVIRMNGGQHLA